MKFKMEIPEEMRQALDALIETLELLKSKGDAGLLVFQILTGHSGQPAGADTGEEPDK